jgi:hypothetical protein
MTPALPLGTIFSTARGAVVDGDGGDIVNIRR